MVARPDGGGSERLGRGHALTTLRGALIASCQPVPDGPTDNAGFIVGFARAARDGGARGLRIEGVANVAAVAAACPLPLIGLVKRDLAGSAVRITPFVDDAVALARAGAGIVAFDATRRARPVAVADMVAAIHAAGALAMADVATLDEAREAIAAGVDVVGTTLSGYVGPGPVPAAPDLDLVRACAALGAVPVFAEGRYNAPGLAAAAIRAGADAVVVGSAITRPEHVAGWFARAIAGAAPCATLAVDIGGSKSAAALLRAGVVLARVEVPTRREAGPEAWLAELAAAVAPWAGRFERCAAAVSGLVTADGAWSAVNPGVLPVPPRFALVRRMEEIFGVPATALNDAQAAAWGEHVRGAGAGRDLVFVTVSSGIGGGIVLGGRLLRGHAGFAGHLGQIGASGRLEDRASGFALARAAAAAGREGDARAVFAAAADGEAWARAALADAAAALAAALRDVQRLVDPERVVVGGGVGLASGFLDALEAALGPEGADVARPRLARAALGHDAGLIGAAEFARGGDAVA
jgi:N-acetylmannosamine-6-phosphate 2-epimerase/N-acetylmannosamine kinase